jgi:hypothetical protein
VYCPAMQNLCRPTEGHCELASFSAHFQLSSSSSWVVRCCCLVVFTASSFQANLSCYPKRFRAKECDGDHRIVGSPRPSSSERSGSQTTKHRNHALKHHPLKHHPTSAFSSATRSFTNAAATASYCHCMTSQLPVQETHQPRKWTVSPPMRSC